MFGAVPRISLHHGLAHGQPTSSVGGSTPRQALAQTTSAVLNTSNGGVVAGFRKNAPSPKQTPVLQPRETHLGPKGEDMRSATPNPAISGRSAAAGGYGSMRGVGPVGSTASLSARAAARQPEVLRNTTTAQGNGNGNRPSGGGCGAVVGGCGGGGAHYVARTSAGGTGPATTTLAGPPRPGDAHTAARARARSAARARQGVPGGGGALHRYNSAGPLEKDRCSEAAVGGSYQPGTHYGTASAARLCRTNPTVGSVLSPSTSPRSWAPSRTLGSGSGLPVTQRRSGGGPGSPDSNIGLSVENWGSSSLGGVTGLRGGGGALLSGSGQSLPADEKSSGTSSVSPGVSRHVREIKEGQQELKHDLGQHMKAMDLLLQKAIKEGRHGGQGGSPEKERAAALQRTLEKSSKENEELRDRLRGEQLCSEELRSRCGELEEREDDDKRYKAQLLAHVEETAKKTQKLEMDLNDAMEALAREKETSERLRESKSQLQVQKRELTLRLERMQDRLEELGEGERGEGGSPVLTPTQQAKAVLDAEREAMEAARRLEVLEEELKRAKVLDEELQGKVQHWERKATESFRRVEELEEELKRAKNRQGELSGFLAQSEAGRKEAEAGRLAAEESSRERAEEAGRRAAQLQEMELRTQEEAARKAEAQLAEEKRVLRNLEKDLLTLRARNQEAETRSAAALEEVEQARKALLKEREEARAREEEKENLDGNLRRKMEDQNQLLWAMDKELQASRHERVLISPGEAAKVLLEGDNDLREENASLHMRLAMSGGGAQE